MRYGQGNRGMSFELLINSVNDHYAVRSIALVNKRPTPVKVLRSKGTQVLKGYFEEKSTVDYDGIYLGRAIAFEAKSVKGKRFDLKNLHDHQFEYLNNANSHGAATFLLLELRDIKRVFFVPFDMVRHYWNQAIEGGRKSIPVDELDVYAYEVEKGRGVALDYLAVLDKLEFEKAISS